MNWSELLAPETFHGDAQIDAFSPQHRSLFVQCWACLSRSGGALTVNTALLEEGKNKLAELRAKLADPRLRLVEVHLACVEAIAKYPQAGESARSDLENIVSGVNTKEFSVPLGLVRDLEHELRHTAEKAGSTPADPRPAWLTENSLLCGPLRPATPIKTPVLFTMGTHGGIVADLTLETVPGGRGDFYPIPALMFLKRDSDFLRAEALACKTIKSLGFWPPEFDVRWRLELRNLSGWPLELNGPSLRGAFELALTRLLALDQAESVNKCFPGFSALRLDGVAVSAGLASEGNSSATKWGSVDGVKEKLDAARRAFPPVHTVALAQSQDLTSVNLVPEAAGIWKTSGDGVGLHVVQAGCLKDFCDIMGRYQGGAGLWPALPPLPKGNVPRERYKKWIETEVAQRASADKAGFIVITADMGRGKSTATAQLVHDRINSGSFPIFFFIGRGGTSSCEPSHVLRSLNVQLRWKHQIFEEPAEGQNLDEADKLVALMHKIHEERLKEGGEETIFLDAADQLVIRSTESLLSKVLEHLPPRFICVITTRPGNVAWRGDGRRPFMEKKLTAPELLDEEADARKLLEERVGGLPTPPHWTFKFPNEIVAKPCPTMFTLDNRLRALEKPILGDPSEEKLRQKLLNDVEEWRAAPEELVREELGRVLAFAEKPENYSNEYEAGKIGAQRALFILGVHACVGRPITLRELEALDAKGKGSTPPAERLFGEDARVILKRAGNFLIGDPWDTEKPQPQPFEFYHPGYARAILEEELYVQADETAPAIPATTGPLRSS